MPRPAFIVEGRMEQKIIQATCPDTPVVLINCNGDNVEVSTMARFIDTQARILKRYDPKIVICDREGRTMEAEAMASGIKASLVAQQSPGNFIVGVADREFENWILAGLPHSYVSDFFKMEASLAFDGCYGKSNVVKGMISQRYQETIHGPALFKKAIQL